MSELKQWPEYACHVELDIGEKPDDCVLNYGAPGDCIYARNREVPHTCKYWQKVSVQPDPAPVDAVARVAELERENVALRAAGEAVKGYVRHADDCETNFDNVHFVSDCTCGLDEALNKWKDATK